MYEEMMKLLDEDDMGTFTALYGKYSRTLSLQQINAITERLKIKVAQQTLINQELKEELKGLTKLEEQLKGIRDVLNENRRRD